MGAYMVRQPVMCSACQGRGIRVRDQDQWVPSPPLSLSLLAQKSSSLSPSLSLSVCVDARNVKVLELTKRRRK
jgi:hypothetical protein